jgi:hypothetical protein
LRNLVLDHNLIAPAELHAHSLHKHADGADIPPLLAHELPDVIPMSVDREHSTVFGFLSLDDYELRPVNQRADDLA